MNWVRPGPPSILPRSAPGGVVIHGYAVPDSRRVFVQKVPAGLTAEDVDRIAEANADFWLALPGDTGICLVAYDGDSGERMAWP